MTVFPIDIGIHLHVQQNIIEPTQKVWLTDIMFDSTGTDFLFVFRIAGGREDHKLDI